jgi:hypothetical protein
VTRDVQWWLRASAVRIGSLWVTGRQVETALGRYTKQLFCLTHHVDYPYAFLGSATAVRFRNKFFLVWCRHQTKEYGPGDVTFPVEEGRVLISGSRFIYIETDDANKDEDFSDLCAMEFPTEKYASANLDSWFFPLQDSECWAGNTDAQFFLFGYPTELRTVEYEVPHVDVKQVVTSGRYHHPSNARDIHCLEMTRTQQFRTDGLSGGPVYQLAKDNNGFFVGLSGIMMRGGDASDFIHFVDARFLLKLLERAWEEEPAALA